MTNFKYMSMVGYIRANAIRHEDRGYNWLDLGYDDRAKGSFRKAVKNHQLADELESIYDPIFDTMVEQISNSILYGTKIYYDNNGLIVEPVLITEVYKK